MGVSLSALWILVANAWMQYPVGMRFDPAQARNVMDNFWAVALSPVAMHKFFHAVCSGWVLAGCFVVGISSWMLFKRRNTEIARKSVLIGSWVGVAGMILTLWSGDGSAVDVARVQPMKLAAMEGLYDGKVGQELVGFGILNTSKKPGDDQKAIYGEISIPYGLSILANHDPNTFVPGINDLIRGYALTPQGDTVNTVSYADRILMGREARQALAEFDSVYKTGDQKAIAATQARLERNYRFFGYSFLDNPEQAVPPVALTFYSFRVMVGVGSLLLLVLLIFGVASRWKGQWLDRRWLLWVGMLSIPAVWVTSEAGWIVAEVGRQPWVIQDLMPTTAAISAMPAGSVSLTFWIFACLFTLMLAAEVSIMLRYINKVTKTDMYNNPKL